MKKNLKKILSAMLVTVLLVCMGTTVALADTTAPTGDNHTYTAYQIFSGTQAEGSAELGSVEWGNGINWDGANGFLAALKASSDFGTTNPFESCTDAASVAVAMKEWSDGSANAKAFAKLARKYVTNNGTEVEDGDTLDAGYYLVIDTTTTVGEGDAYNLALLQLTQKGEFKIAAKNSVPEVLKQVKDGDAYAKANNAAIGDTVSFKITTAVPSTATQYDKYDFIIHDTLSAGLTLTDGTVKVYINGSTTAASDADYTFALNGQSFTITLKKALEKAGQAVVVEYDAVLNSGAAIGTTGNTNTATVEYSNNPMEEESTGTTPPSYSITYTTQLNVFKVDGTNNNAPLKGAKFTLKKGTEPIAENVEAVLVDGKYVANFKGLEEGTYTLVESVIPAGYNPIEDITFTIVCEEPEVVDDVTKTCTWTIAEDGSDVKYVAEDNAFEVTVKNQKGNTLPETGGIGTKIFYVIGAILVAGAAILLITRKRMSKADR